MNRNFVVRSEFRQHGQEIVDLLKSASLENLKEIFGENPENIKLTFEDISKCNLSAKTFLMNSQRASDVIHAYVSDFEVKKFVSGSFVSSVINGDLSGTEAEFKYLAFMTKIFGEEYISEYEKWIEKEYERQSSFVTSISKLPEDYYSYENYNKYRHYQQNPKSFDEWKKAREEEHRITHEKIMDDVKAVRNGRIDYLKRLKDLQS